MDTALPSSISPQELAARLGRADAPLVLDVRRDDVLRSVFERCGLDWSAAQRKLAQGIDTRAAEANREALFAAGLWGVPSFRRGAELWDAWPQQGADGPASS